MSNEQLTMTNDKDLFSGKLVRLAALDSEKDAEALARWDLDSEYLRQLDSRPQLPNRAKKIREGIEKEQSEDPNTIALSVRALADDRLIGFVAFEGINWRNADTFAAIGIGERDYWGKGYGTDALRVLLRFAFDELNLQRVSLSFLEGNDRAQRSYEKCGFRYEGRERQAWVYDGRRWDEIYMGLLRGEWEAMNHEADAGREGPA